MGLEQHRIVIVEVKADLARLAAAAAEQLRRARVARLLRKLWESKDG